MILEDFFRRPSAIARYRLPPLGSLMIGSAIGFTGQPKWQKQDLLSWLDELTKMAVDYVQ